ncbi:hypothetical protein L1281_000308 [Neisseria sp. HSC-16F19]|nr:hypothetical protein [Neisseria sp. HSC-16F19]MCP2039738.1 hypothetical protein [Neisseria sp. HSC-16F19]
MWRGIIANCRFPGKSGYGEKTVALWHIFVLAEMGRLFLPKRMPYNKHQFCWKH